MANYMNGPYLLFPKSATRTATFKQLKDACAAAQAILGDEYVLELESTATGGIHFVDFPGTKEDGYKSIRFMSLTDNWPMLRDGEIFGNAEYAAEVETQTFGPESGNKLTTLLKAFYGAPAFTTTELQAVMSSLALCYENSRVGGVPNDRKLQNDFERNRACSELCTPQARRKASEGSQSRGTPRLEPTD